jgi:hypothetical protein
LHERCINKAALSKESAASFFSAFVLLRLPPFFR